jgi:hypothetical protein
MRDQLRCHTQIGRHLRSDLLKDLHRFEPVEIRFGFELPCAPVGGGVTIG